MEAILTKFKERCDAAGVQHNEFEMQGEPAEAILDEANYFDCVVIGMHTFFNYESGAGKDETFGTDDDVAKVRKGVEEFWKRQAQSLRT